MHAHCMLCQNMHNVFKPSSHPSYARYSREWSLRCCSVGNTKASPTIADGCWCSLTGCGSLCSCSDRGRCCCKGDVRRACWLLAIRFSDDENGDDLDADDAAADSSLVGV